MKQESENNTMEYKQAKKLRIGDPVQARCEGDTNRLITNIEKTPKDIFITLDDGNKYHHTMVNSPILCSNVPFLCSWYGMVTNIDDAPLPENNADTAEWIIDPRNQGGFTPGGNAVKSCSNCGWIYGAHRITPDLKLCPNCGKKMKGVL